MDAVVKAPCDVEIFRKNSLLMIHCLDLNARCELSVKSFPILQLKCIYGHISFMTDLSERRVVVFPDSEVVLAKLKYIKSPCCLEVKSSAIFEVAAEETEDGDEARIAVIWDFEIIAGMAAAGCVVRPVEKTADDLVEMPRLAFKEVTCNCTEFPRVGNVIITTTQKEDTITITELMESCDLDSDISSESEEGEDVEEENDLEKASEANENGGASGEGSKGGIDPLPPSLGVLRKVKIWIYSQKLRD
ncbi:hypothetical protein ACROYT_G029868 [Oculina patagonica]